ncbi:UDP-glucosyltransferase 2-like [Drosophila sulfurigaster albostrigata]|uniref:UDP-glucosyltransferase 2-like n=1 Tax=Drosophila sulfurigaster albostrigata TaxID=89887 RepID=UPI002D21A124|nr:UDP-glucosyltransferase 2-like [Drosophila sulfurigaster albostrigata]
MDHSSNRTVLLALLSVLLISGTQSGNILGVFPSLSPSHLIVQLAMANVLAENGHNVTVITALKPPVTYKNITVVQVPMSEEDHKQTSAIFAQFASQDNSNLLVTMYRSMGQMKFMMDKMRDVLKDQRVTDLYENKDNKFDLVMLGYFLNSYQLGIAHKFKAPVVIAASMPPIEIFNNVIGNPSASSFVPAMNMAVEKGQIMTFVQRVQNFLTNVATEVFFGFLENYNANTYKEVFGDDPNMPAFEELGKNVSLTFFSSHAISEGPIRPNVPAVIEVGGIQIKDKPNPLPKQLAEFLSQADNGAILLSLGSNVKSSHLKSDTNNKIFNVLSKLKQRIIWKWEDLDNTPGKSDNILYSKWLPQDDILAHPNITLFITHAGKGGITEAQYHGKPMLALPIFGDQPSNALRMVKDGFGISLSLLTLEEEPFKKSLTELLENPQYTHKVKTFSALYRDRPMSARESVLYWSEYVMRHHGAPHLQSPLMQMNFIASNNLDVFALLVTVLIVFIYISKFVLTAIYRKLKGKPKNTDKIKRH